MTQMDLSRAADVGYSHIRYVLNGDRQFSLIAARKVANALGCRVEDFCRPPAQPAAA